METQPRIRISLRATNTSDVTRCWAGCAPARGDVRGNRAGRQPAGVRRTAGVQFDPDIPQETAFDYPWPEPTQDPAATATPPPAPLRGPGAVNLVVSNERLDDSYLSGEAVADPVATVHLDCPDIRIPETVDSRDHRGSGRADQIHRPQ